ncbi:hypothetical protein [Paraburkholderia terrae]
MIILALFGIGIAASVVSWYNGKRTAEVERQIAELEAQWSAILAADARERQRMALDYVAAFRRLLDVELAARQEIGLELANALEQARAVIVNRFGSAENDSFLQAVRDIELALARVDAERAYQVIVRAALPTNIGDVILEDALPRPEDLNLPPGFPMLGGMLDLSAARHESAVESWHMHVDQTTRVQSSRGYALSYLDERALGDVATKPMVIAVDHELRTATLSYGLAPLFEASQIDGAEPLTAKVVQGKEGHAELKVEQISLTLQHSDTSGRRQLRIGESLRVYPGIWLLQDFLDASKANSRKALPVRMSARVIATRTVWSPIHLAVSEAQLGQVVDAHQALEEQGRGHEKWDLSSREDGLIAITQGNVTLLVAADIGLQAFVLQSVSYGAPRSWSRQSRCTPNSA